LVALWSGLPLVNAQSSSIPRPWDAHPGEGVKQFQQVCNIGNNLIRRVEKNNVTGELIFLDVEQEVNSSSVPKNVTRGRYLRALSSSQQKQDGNDEKNKNEEDETDECTICFVTLEDGDRVGSLSCQHVFHADCLKMWLKSRNVCPLCLTENIATPRFE
jgi:hypothetical protein